MMYHFRLIALVLALLNPIVLPAPSPTAVPAPNHSAQLADDAAVPALVFDSAS